MFLEKLRLCEKELFLHLCMYAAKANEIIAEEEKNLISAYCNEMGMAIPSMLEVIPLEEVLQNLRKDATMQAKKIIILELLGIMHTDGCYDKKEHDFMEKISDAFGLEVGVLIKIENAFESYLKLCSDLYQLVSE